jgi:chaperonin cofactor prefoldin
MTVAKLRREFFDKGYYGTTKEHQDFLFHLLDYIEALEERIRVLETSQNTIFERLANMQAKELFRQQ